MHRCTICVCMDYSPTVTHAVREAGVRSPTASHQRRRKWEWEVCTSQLGINELGIRLGGLGVGINGLSDSFLLTCGGIESVA